MNRGGRGLSPDLLCFFGGPLFVVLRCRSRLMRNMSLACSRRCIVRVGFGGHDVMTGGPLVHQLACVGLQLAVLHANYGMR